MDKKQWMTGQFPLVKQACNEIQKVIQSNKKLNRTWQSLTVPERLAFNNDIGCVLTDLLHKGGGGSGIAGGGQK